MRVLFVCTGNVCRSPLGELLFRMYTTGTSLEVDSAGTHSLVGHKIDASSAALLASAGIDSSAFRSKQLTRKIADECDLILCFEETQQHNIVTISPSAMRYTFTLTDFSNMCAYCAQQNLIEGITLPERLQSVIAQATTIRPMLPPAGIIADPFRKDFFAFRQTADAVDASFRNILKSLSFGTSEAILETIALTDSPDDAANPPYFRGDVVAGNWSWPAIPFSEAVAPEGVVEKNDDAEASVDSVQTTIIKPDGNDTIALPAEGVPTADHAADTGTMPRITEDTSARDKAAADDAQKRKRRIIIIASAAAVLALVATGSAAIWHHSQTVANQQALSSCEKAASRYAKIKKQYDSVIQNANLLTSISSSELSDASTLDTLKTELSDTYDFIPTTQCVASLSTENLTQAASQNSKNADAMKKSLKSLTAAVDAVTEAREAQAESSEEAAKQALQSTVDQATKLLESSKDSVADEQTRTDLQKAIDSANSLLQNDDATVKQLTEARTAVDKAMQAVTKSSAQYNADNQVYENVQQNTNNGRQYYYYNPSKYRQNSSTTTNGGGNSSSGGNSDGNSGSGGNSGGSDSETPTPTPEPEPDPTPDPDSGSDTGTDSDAQSSTATGE